MLRIRVCKHRGTIRWTFCVPDPRIGSNVRRKTSKMFGNNVANPRRVWCPVLSTNIERRWCSVVFDGDQLEFVNKAKVLSIIFYWVKKVTCLIAGVHARRREQIYTRNWILWVNAGKIYKTIKLKLNSWATFLAVLRDAHNPIGSWWGVSVN